MIETVPSGTVLHGLYRIERVLGSGGFGHVYLAVDVATNQQYALKEYLVSGAGGQEQLKHEAGVLSQLHHPSLAALHNSFHERGRYYMVLNYIEGNDLTDLIRMANRRNEVVPISRILAWQLAICDAVMFLHSQQLIHRDIKPDNIRITPTGTAILVDLGNAKSAADGARTLFFIRHQGTPGYAPPEQYPGGTGTDTRSDVYALGATLYFALTSHEPPSVSLRNQAIQQGRPDLPSLQEQLANNPPEESPEANAARQFRLGVTKPSKPAPRHSRHLAQLGTLPPDLLSQLNRIIQKAMATRPKDRYQYVADFADDLKRVMQAMPPLTPPPTTRTPDPHGTQPDLPMLFEALQAAKAAEPPPAAPDKPARGNVSSPPPVQPPSNASVVDRCPRCNAPLSPGAAFCPRCGLSLVSRPDSTSGPGPVNNRGISTAPSSSKADHDVADDQTLVITPQPQIHMQQAPANMPPQPRMSQNPYATAPASSVQPHFVDSSAQHGSSAPNALATYPSQPPFVGQMSQGPAMQQMNTEQPSGPGFTVEPRIIIFMLIVLVILVVIAVLLIVAMTRAQHAGADVLHWYVLQLRDGYRP